LGGVRARVIGVRLGVVVALAAVATPLVLRSDWANTTVHSSPAPPQLGLFSLDDQPSHRWSAATVPPGGVRTQANPAVQSNTVVVVTAHRIEGHDPRTGATRWYYERRNATVCSWTTQDGQVFAAFRKDRGCRDLVALNAGTGERTWYRNGELNADISLSAVPSVLMAANSHAVVAYDTGGSLARWTYGKAGCTLSQPVAGDIGIALLASCGGTRRLILLDTFSGHERFPAAPVITVGDAATILATGKSIAVLSGGADDPELRLYGEDGKLQSTIRDPQLRYDDPAHAGGTVYSGLLVGWTGRTVFAVSIGTGKLVWSAEATGPAGTGSDDVIAWTADGFTDYAVGDGKVLRRIAASHDQQPAGMNRIGDLVVASGASSVEVYG
jgi:putative pyrroloquinoline-quinone binding quinoprotein